jgi:multimeric flavodoxin WrbA
MRALLLNCTLKPTPQDSHTAQLASHVVDALRGLGVDVDVVRVVDHDVRPGVWTDMGDGDEWPRIHGPLTSAEILVMASPTWVAGRRASPSGCSSGWTP